jgi:hypothetical protein
MSQLKHIAPRAWYYSNEMSQKPPSNAKFWLLASATVVASACALAALWPLALNAARAQSARLTTEATTANGGEAQADYQLATWLDSRNTAAYLGLARLQIAHSQAGLALATLDQAGEGSQAQQLKVRTLIELGRYPQAADAAVTLAAPGRPDDDLVLAALADTLATRTPDVTALIPRLTSPEAAQRVRHAQVDKVTLAYELYATGLPRSSSALLTPAPTSFERNLLLGRIRYATHSPADLAEAADFLASAIALNPAGLEAHQLLANVYRDRKNFAAANQQDSLAVRLQAGKP